MAEAQDFKAKIPPEVVKFIDKNAPREAKLMAARGMVPMPPDILLTALVMLSLDAEAEVSESAKKSLLDQSDALLVKLLAQPIHPRVLDFYGREKGGNSALLEVVLLNRLTPDETFVHAAPQVDERLITIISENQERLLRTPKIAEELRRNPKASQSTLDRVVSFLRMSGIILEGVSPELSREEVQQIMAEDDQNILQAIYDPQADGDLSELTVKLFDEKEDEAPIEDDRQVLRKLSMLTVAQKIRLALKGNKEVRAALIKDPNKIVASSVIKSPKMQDSEVVSISTMRSVSEEVLRLIGANPEWTKIYVVKANLVNNPKTPIPVSMNFIKQLRINEVSNVAKNKNVSQQLQKFAKQLKDQKKR